MIKYIRIYNVCYKYIYLLLLKMSELLKSSLSLFRKHTSIEPIKSVDYICQND